MRKEIRVQQEMCVQQEQPTNIKVHVERCRDGARLPVYARDGDAGMDVCAADDVAIMPGQTVLIPTGLKFAIPPGYEIQVRPRSGISLRTPLRIPNSPGTIDSGYRNEVGIIMTNTCLPANTVGIEAMMDIEKGSGGFPEAGLDGPPVEGPCIYKINKGDRIAQLVLKATPVAEFVEVSDIGEYGAGRDGGLGSTGIAAI